MNANSKTFSCCCCCWWCRLICCFYTEAYWSRVFLLLLELAWFCRNVNLLSSFVLIWILAMNGVAQRSVFELSGGIVSWISIYVEGKERKKCKKNNAYFVFKKKFAILCPIFRFYFLSAMSNTRQKHCRYFAL